MSGKITYKDQPVNNATLTLDPMGDTKGVPIFVPVGDDGTFRATDVPPGEYRIIVQGNSGTSGIPTTKGGDPAKQAEMNEKIAAMQGKQAKPTIAFPDPYKNASTSKLSEKVIAGENKWDLKLTD